MLEDQWIKDVLAYGPFDGDDSEVVSLRDKVIICRKSGECQWCVGVFQKGTKIRSLTEVLVGEGIKTFRFCLECCEAMAKSWSDKGQSIDQRYALGMERRKK